MASIIKVSTTIGAPVETVWENLVNPDNLRHWLTGFVSTEHLTGNPGETGSTSKLIFHERGKDMEIHETVLANTHHQHLASRMTNESFIVESDFRLVSFGHRTELIQTVNYQPKNFFMKLMLPMIKGMMKKRTLNELMKLKNLVETKQSI